MRSYFTSLLIPALLALTLTASAQSSRRQDDGDLTERRNLLKINVPAIALNNYSFQYERAIGKKISAGLGFRFMPKTGLPLKGTLETVIDDEETWDKLKALKTSNTAITPEVRFYFGKSVFRGFYLAPFAKFATYKADLPEFDYTVEYTDPSHGISISRTEEIPLSGDLKTITGGLLIGAQWKLSKLLYLDWWILGPQYGSSKGHLKGTKQLDQYEQQAVRQELEDLDIPIVDSEVHVDGNGARMDLKGPWTGLRAGLALGVRF